MGESKVIYGKVPIFSGVTGERKSCCPQNEVLARSCFKTGLEEQTGIVLSFSKYLSP